MTGDPLPDSDHVSRYCRPGTIEQGRAGPDAFMPRIGEAYLSVNWLEVFDAVDVATAVELMRAVVSQSFDVRPNGRFVVLSVGDAKRGIRDSAGLRLRIEHLPTAVDQSHSAIFMPPENSVALAVELATLGESEDTYPAVV